MAQSRVERRLIDIGKRLKTLRDDLRLADEQLVHLREEADDTRVRALVSDDRRAEREHREAARHSVAMARHRDKVAAKIAKLEADQDTLLDHFSAG